MAPRERPRKKNTRMDAAIESMMNIFGFPDEQLIRDVVNQLLEAYDGEWLFIEEDSYRVLLDALLERQTRGENSGQRDKPPEKDQEDASASIAAEKPRENASSDDDGARVIADLPRRNRSKRDKMNIMAWKDIGMDCAADQPPPPPAGLSPSKRPRRPCYGWIDSDDEEYGDDAFMEFEPAAESEDLQKPKQKSRWDLSG